MGEWAYKAKDTRGKIQAGIMQAKNRQEVQKQLRSLKLRPMSIAEKKDTFFSRMLVTDAKGRTSIQLGGGLPSGKELAVFSKQCSIMIERGVPLVQALGILSAQQKSPTFSRILERIKAAVENGATFSNALGQYPRVFDDLYVAMIRSGEVSGNLDVVLKEIVKFLEKSVKLRTQVKSASIYPSMIVLTAVGVTYGILVFLVPVFADQYKQANRVLPMPTQIVVNVSDFLSHYMIHLFGGIVSVIIGIIQYKKTPNGRANIDRLMLQMPIIGNVVRKIAIGRFTATMSTMLSSGVSIIDALTICAQSSGNKLIERFVLHVRERIMQGTTFAEPLSEGDLFPPMVISMVTIGEQTGALDQTLVKISEIYEEEVDNAVKGMTDSLQPILIISIGIILGFVVIALYLPILDAGNNV